MLPHLAWQSLWGIEHDRPKQGLSYLGNFFLMSKEPHILQLWWSLLSKLVKRIWNNKYVICVSVWDISASVRDWNIYVVVPDEFVGQDHRKPFETGPSYLKRRFLKKDSRILSIASMAASDTTFSKSLRITWDMVLPSSHIRSCLRTSLSSGEKTKTKNCIHCVHCIHQSSTMV